VLLCLLDRGDAEAKAVIDAMMARSIVEVFMMSTGEQVLQKYGEVEFNSCRYGVGQYEISWRAQSEM